MVRGAWLLTTSLLLGVFTKPSISAHPGPIVQWGENVILRCHSPVVFDKFILYQESSTRHFQRRGEMLTGGHCTADFVIGPMSLASVGTYRCYSSLSSSPYEWSAPSDPVDIVITGLSKKPSLSAQGCPVVRSGENVTLVCSSESRTLGARLLEGRAPAEHSRQSSLWVLGPQPTVGSTGAMAPSFTLATCGQTPATHCSCLSQSPMLYNLENEIALGKKSIWVFA
uniref:Immunoglobulin-like beta-sandwich domain-containing protein n=1 Tax=Bos indicus x Bos taurus TaxID=30522 RepID=A0A4W2GM00_BOBOX